jgi:hypothetical protein
VFFSHQWCITLCRTTQRCGFALHLQQEILAQYSIFLPGLQLQASRRQQEEQEKLSFSQMPVTIHIVPAYFTHCLNLQASRRQQEEQEKLLRDFELRRRIRSTVVPTDDGKVRTMLRALGEPITLFGEREVRGFRVWRYKGLGVWGAKV